MRQDAVQRRHKVVRLDTHVQKAANHVDDVIRVDGREHQVTGERRLNRDLRGLGVADFADHDLVGIVTQDRAQSARECQALFLVDRNLRNTANLVFDRILNRDDLVFVCLDFVDRRIQRGRLTASGGPVTSTMPYGSLM